MKLPANDWRKYVESLRKINETAARKMQEYIDIKGMENTDALVAYAHALATKYGEASGALACEMYDSVAEMSGVNVPAAQMAQTATYGETAKAIYGTMLNQNNPVPQTVGRLVKQVAADTTLQNGLRDGAKFAWIPHGDTCAFCLMLASRGWQRVSKRALRNGHAEHIHPNCDCEYAISFDANPQVGGYDPDYYRRIYDGAEGDSARQKINYLRREQYAAQKAKEAKTDGKLFANGEEANVYFGKRPPRALRRENPEEYSRLRKEFEDSMFGKWYSDLSMDQTLSIGEYSGDSYSGINGLLRHEMTEKMVKAWDAVNSKSLDEMINNITDAIDSFELKDSIKVFRTCEKDVLETLKLEIGSVFHDDGFGSTSVLSEKVASGNVVMEINVPKGKGLGAWINPLSGAEDDEFEFLLQRGSNYKVTGFENRGDDLVVHLDLLGNSKTKWSYASREEVIEIFKRRGLLDEEGFAIDRI